MIYPNRDLEELYIAHQSIWDEVFEDEMDPETALEYMRVEPDSDLWAVALEYLTDKTPPI